MRRIFTKENRFRIITLGLGICAGLFVAAAQFDVFHQKQVGTADTFNMIIPSVSVEPTPQRERKEGKPTTLRIPALNITLSVKDGIYNPTDQSWTLTNDSAHYALMTPQPNNIEGNTFIYGHNKKNVFAKLASIKPGDKVFLTTENGYTFVYRFRTSIETNPYDDNLFKYQGPPILTLQTCSGLWFQNRQLFTFDLAEVSNKI